MKMMNYFLKMLVLALAVSSVGVASNGKKRPVKRGREEVSSVQAARTPQPSDSAVIVLEKRRDGSVVVTVGGVAIPTTLRELTQRVGLLREILADDVWQRSDKRGILTYTLSIAEGTPEETAWFFGVALGHSADFEWTVEHAMTYMRLAHFWVVGEYPCFEDVRNSEPLIGGYLQAVEAAGLDVARYLPCAEWLSRHRHIAGVLHMQVLADEAAMLTAATGKMIVERCADDNNMIVLHIAGKRLRATMAKLCAAATLLANSFCDYNWDSNGNVFKTAIFNFDEGALAQYFEIALGLRPWEQGVEAALEYAQIANFWGGMEYPFLETPEFSLAEYVRTVEQRAMDVRMEFCFPSHEWFKAHKNIFVELMLAMPAKSCPRVMHFLLDRAYFHISLLGENAEQFYRGVIGVLEHHVPGITRYLEVTLSALDANGGLRPDGVDGLIRDVERICSPLPQYLKQYIFSITFTSLWLRAMLDGREIAAEMLLKKNTSIHFLDAVVFELLVYELADSWRVSERSYGTLGKILELNKVHYFFDLEREVQAARKHIAAMGRVLSRKPLAWWQAFVRINEIMPLIDQSLRDHLLGVMDDMDDNDEVCDLLEKMKFFSA